MEAGKNSGQTVELSILMYIGYNLPCSLGDVVSHVSHLTGIPVSQTYVSGILEMNDYRIANEGGTLMVEKADPE